MTHSYSDDDTPDEAPSPSYPIPPAALPSADRGQHADDDAGEQSGEQSGEQQGDSGRTWDQAFQPPFESATPNQYPPNQQPPQQAARSYPEPYPAQQPSYYQPPQQTPPQYDQPPYDQPRFDQPQYDQPRYDQPQLDQPQHDQPRYDQPQLDQPRYDQPQLDQPPQQTPPQYDQPRYDQPQYDQPRYDQPPSDQPRYDQPRYDQPPAPASPPQQAPEHGPGFAPHPQPAPATAPPRPEDLLVPDRVPLGAEPASEGWRGRVNRMSGGLLKTRANDRELQLRQAITDIQRGFSRPMTVVVVQPKGGAGKTPTTICLSAAFGAYRGGYVVGWDDNETRGTLSVRVSNPDSQRATVWDLLSDLQQFERFDARVGDLSYYVRPQPDAHFDALVSDDNPGNMAQIGETEFRRLHTVLQRFYRMIVVDTGNNVRSPNWQAAVNAADLVVVVSTYQRDVGYSGSWVLDHLSQTGRDDLARNAVTVLTAADPSTDRTVREQLLQHFGQRTRAVCEIPYDVELAHGGPIRWNALDPETRSAWTLAGATVANCLAEHDERTHNERRA